MSTAIYLDNSATTLVRPEVVEAMVPYLSEHWGNPSSLHKMGRQSGQALALARKQLAKLLNCSPDEIFFSPCGTYSNNTAIIGRARFCEANGLGRHMITCRIEHPAVLGPAQHLESQGWRITYLPVDSEGLVSARELKDALEGETSIVSLMWANNEIGTVQPIDELAAIAADAGVYFHTDAVQVPGKLPIDLATTKVSTLSLSGHKFHAPKGVGVLFVRGGVNLMPVVFGGGQERALFPGTEAAANIVAIGKAAELAFEELESNKSRLKKMQEILTRRMLSVDGVRLTGARSADSRLPGHVSVVVPGADGEALVMQADLRGLCISSGSACHQGIKSPSRILTSIGVDENDAMGSARISAGHFNTEAECEKAAEILVAIFKAARKNAAGALVNP